MTEGAVAAPTIVWRQSPVGVSCKTTCVNKCLEKETQSASPSSLTTLDFTRENTCKQPFIMTCKEPISTINDE